MHSSLTATTTRVRKIDIIVVIIVTRFCAGLSTLEEVLDK